MLDSDRARNKAKLREQETQESQPESDLHILPRGGRAKQALSSLGQFPFADIHGAPLGAWNSRSL